MSLIRNEQTKLTAGYLNTLATGSFTAGVIAPVAAAVFGVTGSGVGPSALTLALGVAIFFLTSIGLHAAARYVLRGLRS